MHVTRLQIRNVRSIRELEWEPNDDGPGWHVILGENGSGKSSFLRCLALALIGPQEAQAARQDWGAWLRSGASHGMIRVDLRRHTKHDPVDGKRKQAPRVVSAALNLSQVERSSVTLSKRALQDQNLPPEKHVWANSGGWFSAAYGPFRRFSGGDNEAERSFFSNPRLGAHVSVFGESVALTESVYWLRELKYKALESPKEETLLPKIMGFVNQEGFLPYGMRLADVSSGGVFFTDGGGAKVSVNELSDGFRSILSMTFELIRQVSRVYPDSAVFDQANRKVVVPGVVMIDEPDAHLHPSWQRKIGFWLTEHFPNLQFVVSTHSPLVCQAAVSGSICVLPSPDSHEGPRMLEGPELSRLLYGDILDAFSTPAFGSGVTASDSAHGMRRRLAELNVKELRQGLTNKERREQALLRATFPTVGGCL